MIWDGWEASTQDGDLLYPSTRDPSAVSLDLLNKLQDVTRWMGSFSAELVFWRAVKRYLGQWSNEDKRAPVGGVGGRYLRSLEQQVINYELFGGGGYPEAYANSVLDTIRKLEEAARDRLTGCG